MQAFALEAFENLSGRLIGLGLLHGLWIGLVVASLVALAFQVFPRLTHQARHGMSLVGLCLVAIGPLVATPVHRAVSSRPTKMTQTSEPITAVSSTGGALELPLSVDRGPVRSAIETRGSRAHVLSIVNAAISQMVAVVRRFHPILVASWLVGMAALGSCLALGARGVQRICCDARPAPAAIQEIAAKLARRAQLKKPPRVMVHPRLNEPCLCGLSRPVILFPECCLSCGDGRLVEAILAHELAHARRLDHVVNLAQRLVEVFLFFSPAVHWLSRSLRRQREFCADALAVRLTGDPLALAGALESVARLRLSSPAGPAVGPLLGGQSVSLLPRIQELIGMMPSRPRPRLWPFAALPAAGIIALIAAACGLSQDQPSATTPDKGRPLLPAVYGAPIAPSPSPSDRQISYEVRFMKLPLEPWREQLEDRLKLVLREADVSAWIIDKKSLIDLMNLAKNVVQAPKVTNFENARATIYSEYKQAYISRLEKVETKEFQGFRPSMTNIDVGWRADVVGSILSHRTHVAIDVRDSTLTAMHTLTRKERFGDQVIAGSYQIPSTIERRCHVNCDVPDGSSVMISLGFQINETPISSRVTGVASKFLDFMGLPADKAEAVTSECLAVITPRRIVLEGDDRPSPAIKGLFDKTPRTP